VIGRWGYFCNLGIKPLISSFLLPPPINPRVQQPLPLSFPFSFFLFFSLISRMFHLSPPFLSVLPLLISFFVLHAHTHTQSKRERPRRRENVRERERELLLSGGEERKNGFLENSVQSASTAPINKHSWSDRAEILQGDSRHVNLHCERWRSDLDQSAFTSSP
jgi:hypothetical protein